MSSRRVVLDTRLPLSCGGKNVPFRRMQAISAYSVTRDGLPPLTEAMAVLFQALDTEFEDIQP